MSRRVKLALVASAVAAAAFVTATAGAGKGGPAPGVLVGGTGVPSADGATRYVARPDGGTTAVTAFWVRGGTVLRSATLKGTFGVPLVAYDGSTAGLSHDGGTLVLGTYTPNAAPGAVSRFAVLSPASLRTRALITLPGSWSFDALSPDGTKLYLVEYLTGEAPAYRVRVYDVGRDRLVPKPVLDPRAGSGPMSGEPVTRANGPGGRWAYTLYRKAGGYPFIHALDTTRGTAMCIDLPWRHAEDAIGNVQMTMAPDGRTLVLRQHGSRLAAVDTRAFTVRAFARPQA